MRAFRLGTLLSVAFGAAACASFTPDAGMRAVNEVVLPALSAPASKVGSDEDAAAARARTQQWLKAPLSVDSAARIALLNNNGLQVPYNELGIAEAVMVQACLTFSLSRISAPVELDIEGRIVADILALATLPSRAEIASDRFRQAQLRAAQETLRVAIEARRSYFRAVAAVQTVAAVADAVSAADS